MIVRFSFLIALLLLSIVHTHAQGDREMMEQHLRRAADEWMAPYKEDNRLKDYFSSSEQALDADAMRQHPLYRHMSAFYDTHRDQYRQLRSASLKGYKSTPGVLQGYEPFVVDTFDHPFEMIQGFANIRTFDVGDTRSALGPIQSLAIHHAIDQLDMSHFDIASSLRWGTLLFVDSLQHDVWKLTYVNRLYAARFDWNINDNNIRNVEAFIYVGEKQTPGWLAGMHIHSSDPRRALLAKMQAFRWSLYDKVEPNMFGDDLNVLLEDFLTRHREDYTLVRKNALARLPLLDDNWRVSYEIDDELSYDMLDRIGIYGSESVLPAAVSFSEIGVQEVFASFESLIMRELKDEAIHLTPLVSWLVGDELYAKELENDVWEIVGVYENYAFSYRWNIRTDQMDDILCWKRIIN